MPRTNNIMLYFIEFLHLSGVTVNCPLSVLLLCTHSLRWMKERWLKDVTKLFKFKVHCHMYKSSVPGTKKCPLCLPVLPPLLIPCSHLLGPAGLRLVLMQRCVLYAIPAGRFFTCARGEGGWRPFKWSTWRLWPVINEFAVSHGSCKETSGSKKKKKEGGCIQTWHGNRLSMQGWKMAAPNMLSLI